MSDFTHHKDEARKQNYINRHTWQMKTGKKSGVDTAGFWSCWLLWNKPTIKKVTWTLKSVSTYKGYSIDKMTKKTLFVFKNKQNKINMDVDESLYNHFQTLAPLQQNAVQYLMTLKLLQQKINKLYYYQ